jgi:hypothetical protein
MMGVGVVGLLELLEPLEPLELLELLEPLVGRFLGEVVLELVELMVVWV